MDREAILHAVEKLRGCLMLESHDEELHLWPTHESCSEMQVCLQTLLNYRPAMVYTTLRETFVNLNDNIPLRDVLAIPEPEMPRVDDLASTTITESDDICRLRAWEDWTDFEEEVRNHWEIYFGTMAKKQPDPLSRSSCSWGDSVKYMELSSEAKLDVNLKHVYDKVNTVLEKTGFHIMLQGGKHQERGDKKIPDLAANTVTDMLLSAPRRRNRCPGELKLSIKFGNAMKAQVSKFRDHIWGTVFSQLHHYLNVHTAKTGYIITDKELFAMKRYGNEWGHVKVSAAIPFHPTHPDALNAKIALWFLLGRYGCHPDDWSHDHFAAPETIHETLDEILGTQTPTASVTSESVYTERPNKRPVSRTTDSYLRHVERGRAPLSPVKTPGRTLRRSRAGPRGAGVPE